MSEKPSGCLFAFLLLICFGTADAQSNPVPLLNQPLSPTSVAPGGSAITLAVSGTGFTSASVVHWNGAPLQTSFTSASQLKATVPAALIAQAGTASITVSTSNGVASNSELFSISKATVPTFTAYGVPVPPLPNTGPVTWPVVADLNGDGKMDVVGGFNNEMVVLLGNGDGSFQTPNFFPLPSQNGLQSTSSTVTGDFNGDGKPDIAVSPEAMSAVVVLMGNGDGTFGAATQLPLASNYNAHYLATGDFNRDGKLDLVSGNNLGPNANSAEDATFSIFLGNGDGTFQKAMTTQVGSSSYLDTMAVGDLNNDGKLDVITTTSASSAGPTFVFFGNGDGTFASPLSSSAIASSTQFLLADLDGDGNLDLVGVQTAQPASVVVCLGDGTGGFSSGKSYSEGTNNASTPILGDINADGKLDVILPTGNQFGVLFGNGDGTFQPVTTYPVHIGETQTVLGDFNGDGMPDLFTGSDLDSNLGIVLLQGSFPVLTSAPTSVTFSQQAIGTTSAAQNVTITNAGEAALSISRIAVSGANAADFAETNTCGTSLAVNATCQVSITFTPTALGTRTAALSVTDNAPGSPHSIGLSGQTPAAPVLALSPSMVTFPGQIVGTSGLPQTVTVTNTGTAALTISGVATSAADFGVLNACGSSLPSGSSCTIGVFFDPTASGSRSGTLSIADNASDSPQTVALSGSGEDFSISASSSSATVTAGQTATYSLMFSGLGGFHQPVALSCSGAPSGSTCSFSSATVTPGTSSPASVTVTVSTPAASLSKRHMQSANALPGNPLLSLSFCLLPGMLVFGIGRRSSKAFRVLVVVAFLAPMLAGLNGCGAGNGGGGGGGNTPMTYNLTITGTYTSATQGTSNSSLSHNTALTLMVQ